MWDKSFGIENGKILNQLDKYSSHVSSTIDRKAMKMKILNILFRFKCNFSKSMHCVLPIFHQIPLNGGFVHKVIWRTTCFHFWFRCFWSNTCLIIFWLVFFLVSFLWISSSWIIHWKHDELIYGSLFGLIEIGYVSSGIDVWLNRSFLAAKHLI
jgi:hypothetical protein